MWPGERPRRPADVTSKAMTPSLSAPESGSRTFSRVIGVGGVRGDLIVSNDELAEAVDSSDEWIRRRTGIATRRRASRGVGIEDLATAAGRSALAGCGVDPAEIDVVIISSVTWMQATPAMAPIVAARLGATNAAAYDINAGCAGYCYGIGQADAMVRSGMARHVLVIGAEKLSDYADPTDRTISFIIGDGAGAAVVGPSTTLGIGPTVWGSDGSLSDVIHMTHSWLDYKYADPGADIAWPTARQEGPRVYRWVISQLPGIAEAAMERAGVTAQDIDVFIPHQANLRIIEGLVDRLGFREDVVVADDIVDTGNTSGASVPLATERLLREGRAHGGQLALQFGFGAGLAFAAQVIELPQHVGALTTVEPGDVEQAQA